VIECSHGTGWRADDRQGNGAGDCGIHVIGSFVFGACGRFDVIDSVWLCRAVTASQLTVLKKLRSRRC
jgi:hypothetical protein